MTLIAGTGDSTLARTLFLLDGKHFSGFQLIGCKLERQTVSLDFNTAKKSSATGGPLKGVELYHGEMVSEVLVSPEPFDQVIVSWNAIAPKNTLLGVEARAATGEGWSRWYHLGWWDATNSVITRTSVKNQKDKNGNVDTDTLLLSNPSTELQIKLSLYSTEAGTSPSVRLIACSLAHSAEVPKPSWSERILGELHLDVPEISQLDYPPRGNVWCSPTSVTMVMNYWASQKGKDSWKADVRSAAGAIHDEAWGGTGNWTFNTAFAGSHPGLVAYCTRLKGYSEAEKWLAAGVPVVLSISANILHGRGESGGGHLVVLVGFDEKGNPIVNDPYAKTEEGQRVQRVYDPDRLLRAWQNKSSLGASYLIYPEGHSIPD